MSLIAQAIDGLRSFVVMILDLVVTFLIVALVLFLLMLEAAFWPIAIALIALWVLRLFAY